MANVNSPFGFKPVGHLYGNTIPEPRPYIMTTGQTIYLQDPVIAVAAGTVTVGAVGQTTTHLGIAAEYVNDALSAGSKVIHVWDDPGIIFAVQVKTTLTPSALDVFTSADIITYAAGYTTSPYLSRMALDTLGQSSKPWKVLGLYSMPNNAWGDSAIVIVVYNQHYMFATNAGI